MPKLTPQERVQGARDRCRPCSPIGAHLLARYHDALHFRGGAGTVENEVVNFYEVCRLVEDVPFPVLSVGALLQAVERPAPTVTASRRSRRVIVRLLRLLQATGELPSTADLRSIAALQRELDLSPPPAQPVLRRWFGYRQRTVGAHELRWEAVKLRQLEEQIALSPDVEPRDLILPWLRGLVRQIVDCQCPPVTRRGDPDLCNCCGATATSHGRRPSPSPQKQRRLRAVASRYLDFRLDLILREADQ